VDLRRDSPTYLLWTAVELSAGNRQQLFVPEGFAHGFQTLTDDTEMFYQMSAFYRAEAARGIRWDDPLLAIAWPASPQRFLSPRDLALPGVA
jgi:dTDP-4-dehydrorhamnose 3,5-epimerase